MATTAYGVNHPLAVKLWAKRLMREALKETYASRFFGTTKDSLIYVKDELNKSAGDRVRIGLRMQLGNTGIVGDGTLEGQEEALVTHSDDLFIDQLRNAVRSAGEMSEQRIPFSVREEALDGLRDWLADRIDTGFFHQIAGVDSGLAGVQDSGMQAVTAPTSAAGNTRILYGDGDDTTEDSLSSSTSTSDGFQLTFIDRLLEVAKTAVPLIRPIKVQGQSKYVLFLHPHQVTALRTDSTANRITWYDIMRARAEGGDTKMNPIYNGALGEYSGVIIHESTRVPLAPGRTAVRRAIFCGAQAACFATGRRDNGLQAKWVEEFFDYENELGVAVALDSVRITRIRRDEKWLHSRNPSCRSTSRTFMSACRSSRR